MRRVGNFELIGAHYLDYRNRKSVCYFCRYQTATNSLHSVRNARDFIWTYYCFQSFQVALMSCLRGYKKILKKPNQAKQRETHAVDSFILQVQQHFEKYTILAYLYHVRNTMTINEPKLSFNQRVTPCCSDLNFGPDCDFIEIQSALSRKLYKILEKQNCNF